VFHGLTAQSSLNALSAEARSQGCASPSADPGRRSLAAHSEQARKTGCLTVTGTARLVRKRAESGSLSATMLCHSCSSWPMRKTAAAAEAEVKAEVVPAATSSWSLSLDASGEAVALSMVALDGGEGDRISV